MKLWLVRHPKPIVDRGICYGHLDLEPESEALIAVTDTLSKTLPLHIPVYTSPLLRAQSLAESLLKIRSDLTLQSDDRLKEMNFGCWESTPWADIPQGVIDAWVRDFPSHRFGGKESAQDVVNRVDSFLQTMKSNHECIWITHAGVIKAVHFLKNSITGQLRSAQDWPERSNGYGECELLEFNDHNRP